MSDVRLDCRHLACPLPVIRISQAMKSVAAGERVTVEASDPCFIPDVRAWAERTGHTLESLSDAGGSLTAVIRRSTSVT